MTPAEFKKCFEQLKDIDLSNVTSILLVGEKKFVSMYEDNVSQMLLCNCACILLEKTFGEKPTEKRLVRIVMNFKEDEGTECGVIKETDDVIVVNGYHRIGIIPKSSILTIEEIEKVNVNPLYS